MKYSKQKEIILDILSKNPVHPNAEHLCEMVRDKHPEMSLATVYRNLKKFVQKGEVKKIQGFGNYDYFDGNTCPHYHMKCIKCGKIYDIPVDIAPDIIQKAENMTGYIIQDCDVIIRGICNNCKQ